MNWKTKHSLRTAAAVGLAATLLTACGSDSQQAATPQDWGTLKTERLTVAHPEEFAPLAKGDLAKEEAAGAVWRKDDAPAAAIYVEFDYGEGINDVDMAGTAAEARVQFGATPVETSDVEVAGTDGPVEARRIDFTSTSDGTKGQPSKGTQLTGMMVAGLDAKERPFLITVNAELDLLSETDFKDIVSSISLT